MLSYNLKYLLSVSPICSSSDRASPVHSEGLQMLYFESPDQSGGRGWLSCVSHIHVEGHTLSLQGNSVSILVLEE